MKKILLALPILFALACNTNAESDSDVTVSETESPVTHEEVKENVAVSIATHDPVCKMERTENWTEFSVYEGKDSVWFCSLHCKEEFDKNPTKYLTAK